MMRLEYIDSISCLLLLLGGSLSGGHRSPLLVSLVCSMGRLLAYAQSFACVHPHWQSLDIVIISVGG